MDLVLSFIISVSFFTIIPMPFIEWTDNRTKNIPLFMPFVGLVIGVLAYFCLMVLNILNFAVILKAVLMTVYFLAITGGVHFDGLMDTADAYFSRRDIDRKLEIMTDSRVGAFGAMTAAVVLLLKFGIFSHLLASQSFEPLILLFIPILSRCMQISMLYVFPKAKSEGLIKLFGGNNKSHLIYFYGIFICVTALISYFINIKFVVVSVVLLLYYVFYYFSSKKNFGGITGDILGAFIELSEVLMLFAVCLF